MEKEIEQMHCLECSALLKGRSDKRYCDDSCRSSYNNRKRQHQAAEEPEFLKVLPKIILQNYQILKRLYRKPNNTIKRAKLEKAGFNFSYITSVYTTKSEQVYYYCFDLGYRHLEQELVLLVQQDSQVAY